MQLPRQLIKETKAKKVFRRNKKKLELKILSALLYFFGLFKENEQLPVSIRRDKSRISQDLLPQTKNNSKTSKKEEKKVSSSRRNQN